MNGQECTSSKWICIDHFMPDDYVVSKDGKRFTLKSGAIPSVFRVELIDLSNEDLAFDAHKLNSHIISGHAAPKNDDMSKINEIQKLTLQNEKLQQEVERLKRQNESDKIVMKACIDNYIGVKQQLSREIHGLKKQIENLKNTADQLASEKDGIFAELNVNILNFYAALQLNDFRLCLIALLY